MHAYKRCRQVGAAFESKRRKGEEERGNAHIKDIERLVTEIEMLKVVLYLVCRNNRRS
jgi:hypothetical protein